MNESKACCLGELSQAHNLTKNRNKCRQYQSKDDSFWVSYFMVLF